MMLAASALTALLLTPFDPALFSAESTRCLARTFYGTFGAESMSLFIPSPECLATSSELLASGSILPAPQDLGDSQLAWIEEAAVEDVVRGDDLSFTAELDKFIGEISETATAHHKRDGQVVMSPGAPAAGTGGVELLHRTPTSALLSLPPHIARSLALYPPRLWRFTPIPSTPVPYLPVPESSLAPVRELLASLRFDPVIASLANAVSVPQMHTDITYLTGEDSASPIRSRHSFDDGTLVAAAYIQAVLEGTGAVCAQRVFYDGFAPNVVCRYAATRNTTATVLLSAHYDSRGSFGSLRAPGGDDDGSGTMAVLAIARTIARRRVVFRSNVELVLFAGEEQGLVGSRAYARELREQDANITVMIQADMLAYHAPGEPAQLGLPDRIGTAEVTQLVANVSAIYSPELKVGYTPACCSDHQSFHEQGFPSSQVFERAGPIADPMYHNSGDLSQRDNYDFQQVKSIAKVQFATLLHAAGYDILEDDE